MRRIAFLGGTFDPFHNGHLNLARHLINDLDFEHVYISTTENPNEVKKTAPYGDRRSIILESIMKDSHISLLPSRGCGYPVSECAVNALKGIENEEIKLWFVIGSDNAGYLESWNEMEYLRKEGSFLFVMRTGYDSRDDMENITLVSEKLGLYYSIDTGYKSSVSSTSIRESIRSSISREHHKHLSNDAISLISERNLY